MSKAVPINASSNLDSWWENLDPPEGEEIARAVNGAANLSSVVILRGAKRLFPDKAQSSRMRKPLRASPRHVEPTRLFVRGAILAYDVV